jgi:exopolyphosphatase/guanosine-5'-triphosphate,3'-diphosphate pyrophosphatase
LTIAIIDLGTNTFNLLIAEIFSDGSYTTLYRTKLPVKLGEGTIRSNIISPMPFERGIKALKTYRKLINKYSVSDVFTFATAAIRDAKNRGEFIAAIKESTGFEVKTITGDEEAEYIYYGVHDALDIGEDPALIMDIGGGSVEFIIGNNKKIFWKQSFLLGAARLEEEINPSDPIQAEEVEALHNFLDKKLVPLSEAVKKYPVTTLIGSSGSFDTFAEVIAYKYFSPRSLKKKTEFTFNLPHFHELYDTLIRSTFEERIKMKGMIPMRADMIVIAAIIAGYVLKKYNLTAMRLSTYALKEGVLFKIRDEKKI